MIPDSLLGLVLLVALLTPGFVYLETRERRHPGIEYSALRETSVVVVASVVALTVSVLLIALLRSVAPGATPDVGAYVRDGEQALRANYVEAFVWLSAAVAMASLFAWLWAAPPTLPPRFVGDKASKWIDDRRGSGVIKQVSGWSAAFDMHSTTRKIVEIVLVDGTSLFGTLGSRSTQIAETDDRDLVLTVPIKVREAGGEWCDLSHAGTLIVSASRIKYMVVSYETRQTAASAASES